MLRQKVWPLLKVTLSCRRRSRLTSTLWGTEFNPTDRWSMGAWEQNWLNYYPNIQSEWFKCFRKQPFCLAYVCKCKKKHRIFLTKGLDAEALRLRTMAGWVLNRVSSISPLIMFRSATPSAPWEEEKILNTEILSDDKKTCCQNEWILNTDRGWVYASWNELLKHFFCLFDLCNLVCSKCTARSGD